MVYLNHEGEIICNHLEPKRLLDIIRVLCKGRQQPIKALCKQFNQETNDGRDMAHYSELLQCAIHSIIEVKEESDIASLFSVGETTALTDTIKGLDDFELIAFLIIK